MRARTELVEIWRRARAAWPSVALNVETFAAHLARHLPADAVMSDVVAQINTADLYLACACAMNDPRALAAFEQHCLGGLDRALGRLRFSADVIAEAKQRVRCRALVADGGSPGIAAFNGRGALRAWVRVMGVREALRMTRRSHRETALPDAERLQALVVARLPAGRVPWLDRELFLGRRRNVRTLTCLLVIAVAACGVQSNPPASDPSTDDSSATIEAPSSAVAGCSRVDFCDESGSGGTVCRQTGCSLSAAVTECLADLRALGCSFHCPGRIIGLDGQSHSICCPPGTKCEIHCFC